MVKTILEKDGDTSPTPTPTTQRCWSFCADITMDRFLINRLVNETVGQHTTILSRNLVLISYLHASNAVRGESSCSVIGPLAFT